MVGDHRDRNGKLVKVKFQLNPMLAPKWDLPATRGGTMEFSVAELEAIFDEDSPDAAFKDILSQRRKRMMAPFDKVPKRSPGPGPNTAALQMTTLFDDDE